MPKPWLCVLFGSAWSRTDPPRSQSIQLLCEPGVVQSVVQPVVRPADQLIVGYEALARMPVEPVQPPGLVAGQGRAVRSPTRSGGGLPGRRGRPRAHPRRAAAVRQPQPVAAGRSRAPCAVLDDLPDRLVIELTEQEAVARTTCLLRHDLEPWLARGVRVAIDDTGRRVLEPPPRHRAHPGLPEAGPGAGARPRHRQEPPRPGQRHGRLRQRGGHQRDRRGGGDRDRARHPVRGRGPPGAGLSPGPSRVRPGRPSTPASPPAAVSVGRGTAAGAAGADEQAVRRPRPGRRFAPGLRGGGRTSLPAGPGHAQRLPRAPRRAALHRPTRPVADPRRHVRIGRASPDGPG